MLRAEGRGHSPELGKGPGVASYPETRRSWPMFRPGSGVLCRTLEVKVGLGSCPAARPAHLVTAVIVGRKVLNRNHHPEQEARDKDQC